jgi:hypothetical protein
MGKSQIREMAERPICCAVMLVWRIYCRFFGQKKMMVVAGR